MPASRADGSRRAAGQATRRAPPRIRSAALALVVGGVSLMAPEGAGAQASNVLSHQVTFGPQGAALTLDLVGGGRATVAFEGGILRIDGAEWRLPANGALEASWRALLARVGAAPGEEDSLLLAWNPPALTGDAAEAAEAIRARLRSALGAPAALPTSLRPLDPRAGGRNALEALFRSGRTRQVTAATEGLTPGEVRVTAGEDVSIGAGETLDASLVVLDGDLTVLGTVTGDVVILGGTLTLGSGARVLGDVRSGDAEIEGNRSAVSGDFVSVPSERALANLESPDSGLDLETLNARIREEVAELTGSRDVNRTIRSTGVPGSGSFGGIGRGVAGLLRLFVMFGILFALGLGTLYFFPRHLEVVARTAWNAAGPSLLVGAAGLVLALPLWIVGGLFLIASIIGIPALLLWVPGGPVALLLAAGLGYVAIARNLGHWMSGRRVPALGRIDHTRPAVHIGLGLAILLAAFAVAHVFGMAGWLDFFEALLVIAGILLTVFAVVVGLGAVILSRAGTDPSHGGSGWGAAGDEGIVE